MHSWSRWMGRTVRSCTCWRRKARRTLVVAGIACLGLLAPVPTAVAAPSPTPDTLLFTVSSTDYPGTFGRTGGVAAGPDGTVYVMDLKRHRVQRFDADGLPQTAWGGSGRRQGQFAFGTGSPDYDTAVGIVMAPDGSIFVADPGNHRVQHFAADGRFLSAWGRRGGGPGDLDTPIDLAVAAGGDVFVQDAGNWRVQRFSAAGAFLGAWPVAQTCGPRPNWPLGLASAPDGTLYVGVYAREGERVSHGCVQHYRPSGESLGQWPVSGDSAHVTATAALATWPWTLTGWFTSVTLAWAGSNASRPMAASSMSWHRPS